MEEAEQLLATVQFVMSEPAFWPPVPGRPQPQTAAGTQTARDKSTGQAAEGRDDAADAANSEKLSAAQQQSVRSTV